MWRELRDRARAFGAGLLALHWLVEGYGYEITSTDVRDAYSYTLKAAESQGTEEETRKSIRKMVAAETFGERFVNQVLGRELGLQ